MATLSFRPTATASNGHSLFGASTAHECVDDVVADDDSTYLFSISPRSALFRLDQPVGDGVINSVTLYMRARKTQSPAAPVQGYLIYGYYGESEQRSSLISLSFPSYVDYSYTWTTDTRSGNPWRWRGVYPIFFFGVNIVVSAQIYRITQVYGEIDYTAAEKKKSWWWVK